MARYQPPPGLDEKLAQMVAARLTQLARIAAAKAREVAPPDKVWVTVADPEVRKEHRDAHGQAVPQNLRFTLDSPPYDQMHYGAGEKQMGRAPLDEDGFTPGNFMNCRCETETRPGISEHIEVRDGQAAGTRAAASVVCEHNLCVTAEFGTDEDQGARYLAAGLREAAARLRR